MPASETLLATFITHHGASSVRPSALRSWLLGIELWHNINGAPWYRENLLHHTIDGAVKNAPSSSSKPKHEPVTLQHLQALHNYLYLSNVFDAAVFAVTCIAFWCCCRLSKLIIDTEFNPDRHIACSAAISCSTASNGIHFTNFHLPHTKTKGSKGDDVNISDSM